MGSRLLWGAGELPVLIATTVIINFALAIGMNILVGRGHARPFWVGVAFLGALYGAEWWFRAAPPHLPHAGLRGEWLPFLFGLSLGFVWLRALKWVWIRRLSGMVFLGGMLCFAFAQPKAVSPKVQPASKAPNLLLVSLDTFRADHVGAYGNETVQTPYLDALADAGVLFERAFAPIAVTGPSHAAMLTGTGPWRSGMLLNGMTVPDQWPSMASVLRAAGYKTGAFVSAFVLDGALGFDRGFKVYDSRFSAMRGFELTGPGRLLAGLYRRHDPHAVLERKGTETVDQALAWLESLEGIEGIEGLGAPPFFAWVHLFDAHGPYTPDPPWDQAYYTGDPSHPSHSSMAEIGGVAPYLEQSLVGIRDVAWVKAQYAGEISTVDAQLGRLLSHLERKGLADNTVVMVVGDHGESFGENGVWFNHGGDLDGSSLAVPMVLRWPGALKAGTRVAETVSVVDVAPTLMALLGQAFQAADGRDVGASFGGGEFTSAPVTSVCYDREMNLKARATGQIQKPTYLLGRMWTDGGFIEIGTHPDRGAVRRGQVDDGVSGSLSALLRALNQDGVQAVDARSESTMERLKALGYLE